ncbi:MAG: DUF2892 domain-containing protein [Bacteroidetes bacterium]|nr:DUF2892 domain-containing protein [Bacteroidota bacterium]
MKANLGLTDRLIRIVLAVVAVVLYYSGVLTGTVGIIAVVVAGILVLTSFISFCPIYALLGIRSNFTRKKT